jgi:hypothetical protein
VAPVIAKIINDEYDDAKKSPPKHLKGKGIFTLTNFRQALRKNSVVDDIGDDASVSSNPRDGCQKVIDHLLRNGMIVRVSEKYLKQAKARTKTAFRVTDDFNSMLTQ